MPEDWMEKKNEKFIYVLRLKENKYYIGQSNTPEKRIRQQFKGSGSAWTKVHTPVKIISIESIGKMNYKEAEEYENRMVIKYMRKHGWENVRGGYFTNVDPETTYKNLYSHKKRGTFDIDFI